MKRVRLAAWVGAAGLAALLFPPHATAHNLTRSFATWTMAAAAGAGTADTASEPNIHIRVNARVASLDLYRARPSLFASAGIGARQDEALASMVRERFATVQDGGAPCSPSEARIHTRSAEWIDVGWAVDCAGLAPKAHVEAFFAEAPGHLVIAQVVHADRPLVMNVLTQSQPWPLLEARAVTDEGKADIMSPSVSFSTWLISGAQHVLGGIDHLAFLLGLLLLGGGFGVLLRIVTAFSVAHSVTLGVTILGYASPHAASVEMFVGLSILLVTAEALWVRLPPARRWLVGAFVLLHGGLIGAVIAGHASIPLPIAIGAALLSLLYLGLAQHLGARAGGRETGLRTTAAALFGLIHGFAFAGSLLGDTEITAGAWKILLGFNLGVEAGQIIALAAAWPLLWLAGANSRDADGQPSVRADFVVGLTAALLFCVAAGWTALRGLGAL